MGLFKKKDKVLDLTDYYNKRKQEMTSQTNNLEKKQETANTTEVSPFGSFFGNTNASSTESNDVSMGNDEKKRRFAIRLKNMTDKMEDLSNQIYHLQQRIELLEKKAEVNNY